MREEGLVQGRAEKGPGAGDAGDAEADGWIDG